MNPLNLIPDKYLSLVKLAAGALAVVLLVVWWKSHNAGQQLIGYDRAMGEDAAEQRLMADEQREREAKNQKLIEKETEDAQQKIIALEHGLAAARADTDRMRDQYREAAARARRQLACPAGAGEGKPGDDPIGVLAELLDRADGRAEAVAGYADRLRIAGESCERAYDALRDH